MPYVQRDGSGNINGLFSIEQDHASEFLADDHADVVAFGAAATLSDAKMQRRLAYQLRADPLFFKWQRGDGTEAEWRAAVAAVQAEYPEPQPA